MITRRSFFAAMFAPLAALPIIRTVARPRRTFTVAWDHEAEITFFMTGKHFRMTRRKPNPTHWYEFDEITRTTRRVG